MTAPKARQQDGETTVRKTTTISIELATKLELLARKRRVSVSWLIGDAIRELVDKFDIN